MNSRASHVVISSLLIFSLLLVLTTAAYLWGDDYIQRYKDVATFEGVRGNIKALKIGVDKVSHEGNGSRKFIKVHIPEGRLEVNGTYDYIVYEMESEAKIVEAGASVEEEGIILESDKSPRGGYITRIIVNYSGTMVDIMGNSSAPKGYYTVKLENIGYNSTTDRIKVLVEF